MPNIGPMEIVVVLIIVLVIFGPKRLPEMGRSLGRGIREFKSSVTKDHDYDDDHRQIESADTEGKKVESSTKAYDRRA